MQYSLRTLLILVTLAAAVCSILKVAAILDLIGFAELLLLAIVVSAVPATIVGRRIDRTFESLYLGIIWGVWVAMVISIHDFLAHFFETLNPWYISAKVAAGALIGGCFGGCVTWRIKKSVSRASAVRSTGEKET
jgi:hypothetical protein